MNLLIRAAEVSRSEEDGSPSHYARYDDQMTMLIIRLGERTAPT